MELWILVCGREEKKLLARNSQLLCLWTLDILKDFLFSDWVACVLSAIVIKNREYCWHTSMIPVWCPFQFQHKLHRNTEKRKLLRKLRMTEITEAKRKVFFRISRVKFSFSQSDYFPITFSWALRKHTVSFLHDIWNLYTALSLDAYYIEMIFFVRAEFMVIKLCWQIHQVIYLSISSFLLRKSPWWDG